MLYPNDFVNKIVQGDCLELLKQIPDNTINCCVTSPPYYGTNQIGLEKTPYEYVDKMVEVFREVRRILCNDGTLWLGLDDSYHSICDEHTASSYKIEGFKPKDLYGIPWRTAFALQNDGWYLRQDLIWNKTVCVPEDVKDRCIKAHEYIFLMTKSSKYYFDYKAIKEPSITYSRHGLQPRTKKNGENAVGMKLRGHHTACGTTETRNKRSVWTFSTKLIEPCILAGCPKEGIVLDPFIGSGTVAAVARQYGRNFIGIESNPEYCEIGRKRIDELSR